MFRRYECEQHQCLQQQHDNLMQDLHKTQRQLQETQHKLSFLFERNPLAVIQWNVDFEVEDWNPAAEKIFGYSKQEALNRHAVELIVPQSAREHVNQIMGALLKQEGGIHSTNENLTKEAEKITCEWYNAPLTDCEGNITGILSIVEDITNRRNIEAALVRSEARFKKLAANLPGMIYQFRIGSDGVASFPYVSEGSREIYGIEPEAAQNNSALLTESVHPDDKNIFLESIAISAQTLANWDWQGRILSQTGNLKWVRGISRPELQSDGSIVWDGLLIDISERQQALLDLEQLNIELEHRVEERTVELQQSQQLLKLVFDTLPQRVFWKDINYKYLGCNQKFADDIGIASPEEIIGKDDFELFENPIARLHRNDDTLAIKTKCAKVNYEETQLKEDGSCIWLRKNKIAICDSQEDVIGVFGSYEDITPEKQAIEALRDSEAKFRSLVENSNYLIYSHSLEGIFSYISPNVIDILGYEAEVLIGQSFAPFIHTDDLLTLQKFFKKIIKTGNKQAGLEFRVKGKNNTWCWMKTSISPILNCNGDVISFQGMASDITERKLTQEKLLRISKAVESTSDAIGIADPEGNSIYHNPAFVEMFGYSVDELNQNGGPSILYNHQANAMQVFTTIKTGQSWRGEVLMKNNHNASLLVELKADVIKDEVGRIIGLIGTHTDITERKQAEIALQKSLKEIADIKFALDQSSIIAVTNHQGIIEYVNDKFTKISQYTSDELIGKTHKLINSGYHPQDFFQNMWQTIRQGKVWKGEIKNRAKDGTYYWVDTTIVPLLDTQGKPQQYVAIRNDITARKQAEVELNKQTKELEQTLKELQSTQSQLIQSEKMSSLGQLVAGVAHEINNPVNFIFGNLKYADQYTQNLLKIINLYQTHYPETVAEIQAEALKMDLEFLLEDLPQLYSSMNVGATRIREIVASLRTFSRLDEADLKAADIHEGIDSTLMILEHRLKPKLDRPGIAVIKEYGTLPLVECYAGQLNQVFMNILVNAIDALEENCQQKSNEELTPTIHINTEITTSNHIIIRIRDNGVGISQEVRKKLFDPFYTTKPIGKGTGMGLSISYQIITDRHGGSLKCISSPQQGAEFIIAIPNKQNKT